MPSGLARSRGSSHVLKDVSPAPATLKCHLVVLCNFSLLGGKRAPRHTRLTSCIRKSQPGFHSPSKKPGVSRAVLPQPHQISPGQSLVARHSRTRSGAHSHLQLQFGGDSPVNQELPVLQPGQGAMTSLAACRWLASLVDRRITERVRGSGEEFCGD